MKMERYIRNHHTLTPTLHRAILLLILGLLPAISLFSQPASVASRLDSASMLIGDQTGMTISFTGPSGAQVFWPSIPDTILGNIRIISRSPVDSLLSGDRGTITLTQRLLLTCFDSGFYTIPSIPVGYRLPPDTQTFEARTDLMMLMVQSIPVDTTQAIKPIKEPMAVPLSFREILPWLLLGIGILAVAFLLIWYIRKRKNKEPAFVIKPRPQQKPWEKALAGLEALREKRLWQQGQIKDYYSALTDILRVYMEENFSIPAMESTTAEIMDALQGTGREISADALTGIQNLLTDADLVKFAKALPLPSENEMSMDVAVNFVRNTIRKEGVV